MQSYDAVIILGGGIRKNGNLPTWVIRRLKKALEYKNQTKYFITSSAYTTNKAPVINRSGFPVNESVKMGEYLVEHGVGVSKILTERWSHDTIGNAYFSRLIHTDQLNLKKLLIITSEFHMPRSKAIFKWIFSMNQSILKPYQLDFVIVSDAKLRRDIVLSRIEKEQNALIKLNKTKKRVKNLSQLHQWLFKEHGAYCLKFNRDVNSPQVLKTY